MPFSDTIIDQCPAGVTQVTTLTNNAQLADWSDTEYRDAYEELRQYDEETGKYGISLDAFVDWVGAPPSKGMWSAYHTGKRPQMTRQMKQRIRVACSDPLPPSVDEALSNVSANAEVVSITKAAAPDRVILAHSDDHPVTIHLNGSITVTAPVTAVTKQTVCKPRQKVYRPVVSLELKQEIEASGCTVAELIRMGLTSNG